MTRKKKINADPKYRLEIFWSPEDQSYIANVPELSGCTTHGETVEEAVQMAHEAIDGYIESCKARGLPIPKPLSEKEFSGKIPLRIDPKLHRDLTIKAEIKGVSLNKFIESKLKKAV